MAERSRRPVGVARRLRRFVLIVIWVVPLTYFSMFIGTATGGNARGLVKQLSGTATVQHCNPDGPLGMHFWYSCQVDVRWDAGSRSREVVPPPDLGPTDVGKQVKVELMDSRKGRAVVQVQRDRPWAWVWWVTGGPSLGLAFVLALIGTLTLAAGTPLDFTRNVQRPQGSQS